MSETENLMNRANLWLDQNNDADPDVIHMVQSAVDRMKEGKDLPALSVTVLKTAIKGTRVRVTLSDVEEDMAREEAKTALEIIQGYGGHLSIPREKSLEAFEQAFIKAALAVKRQQKKGDA